MTSSELAIANLKQAGLAEVLYTPGQEAYDARVASYWSLTARLKPRAFVQPRDVGEVSQAVSALVKTPGCNFAVRRSEPFGTIYTGRFPFERKQELFLSLC